MILGGPHTHTLETLTRYRGTETSVKPGSVGCRRVESEGRSVTTTATN